MGCFGNSNIILLKWTKCLKFHDFIGNSSCHQTENVSAPPNVSIFEIKHKLIQNICILPELVVPSSLQYQDFCFLAPTHILDRLYCCSNWDTSVSVYACCTVELNSISLPPSDTQSDCVSHQDLYELLFILIHLSLQLVRWDGHTTDPLLGPTREGYHNVTMS